MSAGEWIDLLLSPDGRRLLAELTTEPLDGSREIALIGRLRARYAPALVAAALTQVRLRRRAASKFTHAGSMLFTAAGLEQASSERMAAHHAERFASRAQVADLCCGIGGDLIGLARVRPTIGVDYDPVHARLAAINAAANGVGDSVRVVCADVRDLKVNKCDGLFVDPARRAGEARYRAGASDPPLEWCLGLAHDRRAVGIKAAPGLPLDVVPAGWEIEFVSEGRELKEAALWSPALATEPRRATLLDSRVSLIEQAGQPIAVRPPGAYLYDPDPAVTRAGLVETLARQLGDCWKIDDEIAFLSSNVQLNTPFARTLVVEASESWSLARLKVLLSGLYAASVDIRKRGSAVDVDAIQRRLKFTGTRPLTVVLTRAAERPWMLVCSRPGSS